MKISSTSEPIRPDRTQPSGTDTRAVKDAASGSVAPAPDLAARLSELETRFAQSDFDAGKVNEVRAAIAEGRFTVNAEKVADGLLQSASDLLGKRTA